MENDLIKTSKLSIASLVFGIMAFLYILFQEFLVLSIPAVMCGHIAKANIRKKHFLKGKRLAITGLALGYFVIILTIVSFALVFTGLIECN